MTGEKVNQVSVDDSDRRMRLAGERTLLAYERTQNAWVRTAFTLISFSFAISEFFTYLRQQQGERATMLSPRAVDLTMVVMALIGLTLATWHHQRAVKLLRRRLARFAGADGLCDGSDDRISRRPRLGRRPASLDLLNSMVVSDGVFRLGVPKQAKRQRIANQNLRRDDLCADFSPAILRHADSALCRLRGESADSAPVYRRLETVLIKSARMMVLNPNASTLCRSVSRRIRCEVICTSET